MIGTSFSTTLLFDLLESTPGECLEALDHAAEAGFVQRAGDDRYEFTHAVFRDVVYYRVSDLRRVAEHLRVGEAIEARFERGSRPVARRPRLPVRAECGAGRARSGHRLPPARGPPGRDAVRAMTTPSGFYRRALQLIDATVASTTTGCAASSSSTSATHNDGRVSRRPKDTLLQATSCAVELGDHDLATRAVLGLGPRHLQPRPDQSTPSGSARSVTSWVSSGRLALPLRARLLAALSAELIFDDDPDAGAAGERRGDVDRPRARRSGHPRLGHRTTAGRPVASRPRRASGSGSAPELDAIPPARRVAAVRPVPQRDDRLLPGCAGGGRAGARRSSCSRGSSKRPTQLRQPATVGFAKLRLASRVVHRRTSHRSRTAGDRCLSTLPRRRPRRRRSVLRRSAVHDSAGTRVAWARSIDLIRGLREAVPGDPCLHGGIGNVRSRGR